MSLNNGSTNGLERPPDQFSFKQMSILRLAGHEIMTVTDDPLDQFPFLVCKKALLTKRMAAACAAAIIRVLMDECSRGDYHDMMTVSDALCHYAKTYDGIQVDEG